MLPQSEDQKLLVVHSNSGMSSVIDVIMFCDDVAGLRANQVPTGAGRPNFILQDCKMVRGDYLLICRNVQEGQIFQGIPVVVATARGAKSASVYPGGKPQDMNRMASIISNLISVFGFTYLVMNKPARAES